MTTILTIRPASLLLMSTALIGAIGSGPVRADDAVPFPGDGRTQRHERRPEQRSEQRRDERREATRDARQEQRGTRQEQRDDRRDDRRDNRREAVPAARDDASQPRAERRQEFRAERREDRRDAGPPIRQEARQAFRQERREDRREDRRDFRQEYRHAHRDYPHRGAVIRALPRQHRVITYRSTRYYFDDGIWYRPFGASFMVIAPPIGIVVPFLPLGYITMQIGSDAYYVANDVFYARRGDGYVVVEPPAGAYNYDDGDYSAGQQQIFIYPRNGQSAERQARDRYECHSWAREQTGFDPTRQVFDLSDAGLEAQRSDYYRAMGACLDARGYTVR